MYQPPPPLPLRNLKTKLSSNSLPFSNSPSASAHSDLAQIHLTHSCSSSNAQTDFPPIPPSPITDTEVALYHQKHSTRCSFALTGTGSLGSGKHSKRNLDMLTQSTKNLSTNNEEELKFGKDQFAYSLIEDKQTPRTIPKQEDVLSYPEQDILIQSHLSNSSQNSDIFYNHRTPPQIEDFNACSPPNDLLAACLNELTELQGFSSKRSETDSNSSNFSLQELSQLKSPSIPKIDSSNSLDISMRCDDLGIEDLDALIADLDQMTHAIRNHESEIQPTTAPPVIPLKLHQPPLLDCKPTLTNPTPDLFQQFNQQLHCPSNLDKTELKEQPAAQTTQIVDIDSKQAKISIALSKLKRANQKRVVLKIYDINMSYKMVVIDENMNSRNVCSVMAEKNHQIPGPNWCLVESLGTLGLERTIEDHEKVLDVLSHWPRQHTNFIIFKNISDKYLLLKKPQLYMPSVHPLSCENESKFDDATRRRILIKELFYDKTLPYIANVVSLKIGKKSSWRKIYCVLRTSGLYYSKSKKVSTKHLVNLVSWKNVRLYKGQRYGELYKSPDKFCCSLIPSGPLDQTEKSIVHLSFSNKQQLECWMACISLAKYSVQLFNNYIQNFELYPWLENGGELSNSMPESDTAVIPRSQESALTSEEKQMLHNELQMNSLTNPLIDSLDVLDERRNKWNQCLDIDPRDSVRKSSKIAATFSNAWVAGDSKLPHPSISLGLNEDKPIDRQQPFSYTQSLPVPTKFTLV